MHKSSLNRFGRNRRTPAQIVREFAQREAAKRLAWDRRKAARIKLVES